jgi:hypothetical protein
MGDAEERRLRWIAWSMRAGALFDLFFAVAILGFTARAARTLGLVVPADPVYLKLSGVLLLLLAGLYCLPGWWPRRYRGVVVVAAAGRFIGAVYLGLAWWGGQPTVFLAVALVDLGFSLLHTGLLLATRDPAMGANA